jgi:hypothetical protein
LDLKIIMRTLVTMVRRADVDADELDVPEFLGTARRERSAPLTGVER